MMIMLGREGVAKMQKKRTDEKLIWDVMHTDAL